MFSSRSPLSAASRWLAAGVTVLSLAACGGGGGGGGGGGTPPVGGGNNNATPPAAGFANGTFAPSSNFINQCLNPRAGTVDQSGTAEDENNFLRSWSNELYLWYDEIADQNPQAFDTPAYFDLMKTTATTASGAQKDKFHFTIPTDEWEALSQSGISAGYGAELVLLSATPPRSIVVGYISPGTPAAAAGLARGTAILTVDGVDVANGSDVATLNAALFPDGPGEVHTFVVQDVGAPSSRTVNMTSAEVTEDPVQFDQVIATPNGPVGYMFFSNHIATAEQELVNAMTSFQTAGITELVLDLRYNGGGFLDIANALSYMIAGNAAASGRVFEELQFNDKHTVTNPVTGQTLTPSLFHETTQGFSGPSGQPLPTVNLSRVVVLTGNGTCSASESIMNGLRGIGIDVVMIGDTTCGKPYGFYAQDNCGTTYFSIQFRGVNAQNFGDYSDGFSPEFGAQTPGTTLPGCFVADDFNSPLGDPAEAQLAAALAYIDDGSCPVGTTTANTGGLRLQRESTGEPLQGKVLPGRIARGR